MMPAISGPAADVASEVMPQMIPHAAMQMPMTILNAAEDNDVWRWWSRTAAEHRTAEKASVEDRWNRVQKTCPNHRTAAVPAVNGNIIPAKSLSTFISHRIFAKIAINFYNFAKIG